MIIDMAPETEGVGMQRIAAAFCDRAAGSDLVRRESAERMARELPRGRCIEVANSGHGIHLDNATALIAAIRTFLREGQPAAATP